MSLFNYQYLGGNCTLCGSEGVNRRTCPRNPKAINKKPDNHPLAKKNSKMNNSNSDKIYEIIYSVNYMRTNDNPKEEVPDPKEKEFETYVEESVHIPEHPVYMADFEVVHNKDESVKYIGNRKFRFRCKTHLSPAKIADAFFNESLADGEWEASPGNGSFVYPTKDGEELGLIGFDEVIVNGQSFKKNGFLFKK